MWEKIQTLTALGYGFAILPNGMQTRFTLVNEKGREVTQVFPSSRLEEERRLCEMLTWMQEKLSKDGL